ncbi:MAG: hypothetical protein JNM66_18245 [Bryobacterales bacterium]|nr:hypothetical protein [Bryobacterales bacterium]
MIAFRPAQVLAAVFLLALTVVWWLAGDRLILINDEGIYLDHAARIAQGEVLYRDLFGITGPGAFWLLAIVFKVAGISLAAAHVVLAVEIAILATVIYFVTRQLSDAVSAGVAAAIFLAFNVSDAAMMTNNHRWDADTYAILGIVAIWRGRGVLGGFLLALSVWTTPIFALTAVTAAGAALIIRQSAWRVVAGGAAGFAAGLIALLVTGSFPGFIENLLWAKDNYSEANTMGYGAVIGGYPALFDGASGALEYFIRGLIVVGMTLPVWLPPLCGVLILRNRDRNLIYFAVCGLSMIAGVSPRFDVGHLVFAVPLFYPIAASFLQRARWTVLPIGAIAGLFLFSAIVQRSATEQIDTPIGRVRTDPGSAEMVRWLTSNVQPGERLFVYPYPPIAYFLTRAQNVSRFCVLQPGLFTLADEQQAAADIRNKPPSKIIYMDIAKSEYLRIWPASDPNRLELRFLHQFVTANYAPTAQFRNLHVYMPIVRANNSPQ